jgi:hypothetical protein
MHCFEAFNPNPKDWSSKSDQQRIIAVWLLIMFGSFLDSSSSENKWKTTVSTFIQSKTSKETESDSYKQNYGSILLRSILLGHSQYILIQKYFNLKEGNLK